MNDAITVKAEHIAGIEHTEVSLPPGVSVLTGRNATNRSSFLQAIMAALGSERASLKADADEGHVEFHVGDEVYTRTLMRQNGGIQFRGDLYLDDPELADLFAFLLEDNEARRAVERGDDLREIIMRPIDTTEIEREIKHAEGRKRDIDDDLDQLDRLSKELPSLKSERSATKTDLKGKRKELAAVEDKLTEVDVDPDESKERKEELEAVFEDLRVTRAQLDDVEFKLDTERATVDELEAEREDLEAEIDAFGADEENTDQLEGRITELRTRKRTLDETISELQSVIGFNEEMLEGDGLVADDVIEGTEADGGQAVTDQLVAEDTTTCWTCGSEVERRHIEDTLEHLRSLRSKKLSERTEVTQEIEDLEATKKEHQQATQEREHAQRRLQQVETELEQSRERIEDLENQREDLEAAIDELEEKTEDFDDTDYSEALDLHREANRLEFKIDRLESDVEDLDERITDIEEALQEREELEDQRELIQDELTDLRMRVDRIEGEAVEEFNNHIASLLDILEYENIDRIWIERREDEVREGRRKVTQSIFDLHIVRSTDGSAYRDSVDHLSESEREVTGLVFALAGYLVHDVHEELPVMLLDSLEAIDSDRIATLIDYFRKHVEYLVVALLPEDAQTLDDDHYSRIDTI